MKFVQSKVISLQILILVFNIDIHWKISLGKLDYITTIAKCETSVQAKEQKKTENKLPPDFSLN